MLLFHTNGVTQLIRQYQTEIVQKDREIKRTRVEASSEEPPSKKAKRSSEDDDNDDLTASKEYAKHIRDLGAKYACLYVTWGEPEDIFGWEELQDDLDAEIEATATDTDSEEAGSGGEVSSGGRGMGNASQEETDEEEDDDSVEAPPTARITLEMIEEVEAGVDMLTTEAGQRDYTTLAAKEFYKALNRNDRHNFFKPQFQKLVSRTIFCRDAYANVLKVHVRTEEVSFGFTQWTF